MNDSSTTSATAHSVPGAAPGAAARLNSLGIIGISGADAKTFLQGQLTFDMGRLTPQYMELAAVNSAQGRVQAVVRLIERTDRILLLVAADLLDTLIARLRKFVMRAKVKIEAASDLAIGILTGESIPAEARGHTELDGISTIRWPGAAARGLVIAPSATAMTADPVATSQWHLEDIRAGLPQVFASTHEAFIAQMLNLDLLQGVSFDKGCYTGQEIIARMHFRGQVKRRMLRFAFAGMPPAPGTRVVADNNHAGDVVDAALTDFGCELLAVISLAQRDSRLELDGEAGKALDALPLPYPVDPTPA